MNEMAVRMNINKSRQAVLRFRVVNSANSHDTYRAGLDVFSFLHCDLLERETGSSMIYSPIN